MQIQSLANLLQQSLFNQKRDSSRYIKAAERLRISALKKLQAKDQGKYTKKTGRKLDKKQNQEQFMINRKGKNTWNIANEKQSRTSSKSGYTCRT